MGYRSEVLFVAAFKDDQTLANFLAHRRITNWKLDGDDPYTANLGEDSYWSVSWGVKEEKGEGEYKRTYERRPFLMFHINDVKWYQGYDTVEWVESLFDEAVTKWDAGAICYRIGEERDDIQQDEFCSNDDYQYLIDDIWDCFQIERYIAGGVDNQSIKEAMKQLGEDNETK